MGHGKNKKLYKKEKKSAKADVVESNLLIEAFSNLSATEDTDGMNISGMKPRVKTAEIFSNSPSLRDTDKEITPM